MQDQDRQNIKRIFSVWMDTITYQREMGHLWTPETTAAVWSHALSLGCEALAEETFSVAVPA